MKRLNLALALAAAALLALSGIAIAKDRHGDDHGRHHGHHGHRHEHALREAGTISSFDATTGKLTIALPGGETFTGMVTDETRIKCEGVDDRLQRRDRGSDDNGGRGIEPGDDNGGHGEEPGDDNGGEAPAGAPACSTASLTPGEIVGSAELRLEDGAAVFDEVELGFRS